MQIEVVDTNSSVHDTDIGVHALNLPNIYCYKYKKLFWSNREARSVMQGSLLYVISTKTHENRDLSIFDVS